MTTGIICTVVLGLIALYQTLAARAYREAALLFRVALDNYKKALSIQHAEMQRANARLEAIDRAMPLIRAAAARGDARGTYNALATALNAAAAPSPGDGR